MKINPDDPIYPSTCEGYVTNSDGKQVWNVVEYPGLTIRLKLAAMMMQGYAANPTFYHISSFEQADMALCDADTLIERANRDEGTDDGK